MCYTSGGPNLFGFVDWQWQQQVTDWFCTNSGLAGSPVQLHWHEWQMQVPAACSNGAVCMSCSRKWSCVHEHTCLSLMQPSFEWAVAQGPLLYMNPAHILLNCGLWYQLQIWPVKIEWMLTIIIMLKWPKISLDFYVRCPNLLYLCLLFHLFASQVFFCETCFII